MRKINKILKVKIPTQQTFEKFYVRRKSLLVEMRKLIRKKRNKLQTKKEKVKVGNFNYTFFHDFLILNQNCVASER